jgi:hypothetical protein
LGNTKSVLVVASAVLATVLLLPLWGVVLPAMADYPAHVSALYVQMHGHDPSLSRFYQTEWDFVPDLASEILVPVFAAVVPFLASVKLFLSLALLMWIMAPIAIHYALTKRIGVAALAGALFAYNAAFMWGFLNFYFATGLALMVFAAWIASEKHSGPWRTAAFALATLVVFFSHALAMLLLVFLLLSFEATPAKSETRHALPVRIGHVALVALPSTLFFFFLRPHAMDSHKFSIHIISSFPARLAAVMQDRFDTAAYVPLIILLALVIAGLWMKRIKLHPRMTVVLGALAILCVLAPSSAGGGWGTHIRFPAVVCLLFFASMEVRLEPRLKIALLSLVLGLGVFNAATLYLNWHRQDRQIAEFRSATQSLSPGSTLFTVLDMKALGNSETRPYRHVAEYAFLDRQAFVPLMFTTRGQHVVHTRSAYEPIAALSSAQGHEAPLADLMEFAHGDFSTDKNLTYLDNWPCHYDAVVVVHLGHPQSPVPPLLRLRHTYSFFSLYDVARPASCHDRLIKQVRAG